MTRLAITGSTGLVGRALRDALRDRPDIVPRYLLRGPAHQEAEVTVPSLEKAETSDWLAVFADTECVIHLAARLPGHARGASGQNMQRINVDETGRMAVAAAEAGVRRVVFISTLGVYGLTSGGGAFRPGDEERPWGPYAQSKLDAEKLLRRVLEPRGVDLVILRPPAVYGPGTGGQLGALMDRVRSGKWLPLGRVRSNRRQLIGSANLASAILFASTVPDAPGPPLLPTDNEAVSTTELIELIAEFTDQPVRSVAIPEGLLRLAARVPVLGRLPARVIGDVLAEDLRLRNDLGWSPPLSLREGMALACAPGHAASAAS